MIVRVQVKTVPIQVFRFWGLLWQVSETCLPLKVQIVFSFNLEDTLNVPLADVSVPKIYCTAVTV